VRIGTGA
jgi:hypothetical protein